MCSCGDLAQRSPGPQRSQNAFFFPAHACEGHPGTSLSSKAPVAEKCVRVHAGPHCWFSDARTSGWVPGTGERCAWTLGGHRKRRCAPAVTIGAPRAFACLHHAGHCIAHAAQARPIHRSGLCVAGPPPNEDARAWERRRSTPGAHRHAEGSSRGPRRCTGRGGGTASCAGQRRWLRRPCRPAAGAPALRRAPARVGEGRRAGPSAADQAEEGPGRGP